MEQKAFHSQLKGGWGRKKIFLKREKRKRSSAHNLYQLPSITFLVQGSGICSTPVKEMRVQKAGTERNEYEMGVQIGGLSEATGVKTKQTECE